MSQTVRRSEGDTAKTPVMLDLSLHIRCPNYMAGIAVMISTI
jgi:hypothetical protein